jgi:hypothetical protein
MMTLPLPFLCSYTIRWVAIKFPGWLFLFWFWYRYPEEPVAGVREQGERFFQALQKHDDAKYTSFPGIFALLLTCSSHSFVFMV